VGTCTKVGALAGSLYTNAMKRSRESSIAQRPAPHSRGARIPNGERTT